MAKLETGAGSKSGPGNRLIATTLLECLAARGDAAARERAVRAIGSLDGGLQQEPIWLPDDSLARMWAAADVTVSLSRSVGHRLMQPDSTGLSLYGLGLASPEKALRRIQTFFPRERAASRWVVDEIASGAARLSYSDRGGDDTHSKGQRSHQGNGRCQMALCALRVGMLEAVPGLFGLLPARVTESTCLARGADACRYEVVWERTSRRQLQRGIVIGSGLAAATLAATVFAGFALPSIATGALAAIGSFVLCVALGGSLDLVRQLEAVAGARRGHLALFDQVDDALASKLDALARANAKLEGGNFGYSPEPMPAESFRGVSCLIPNAIEIHDAALRIHAAAGDLECWFENGAAGEVGSENEEVGEARGRVRKIKDWAARIADDGTRLAATPPYSVDLVTVIGRAIASARPAFPRSVVITFSHGEDSIPIVCEPVQIEQVVVQLLRNAVEASMGLSESPEVCVDLRKVSHGVEFSVEDRGVGLESTLLDEVFDPFFGDRRAGIDEGFGLPVCLRIVERHGGALRIEAEGRPGTRVSVFLPESPS